VAPGAHATRRPTTGRRTPSLEPRARYSLVVRRVDTTRRLLAALERSEQQQHAQR
jgi:hypothetical protein